MEIAKKWLKKIIIKIFIMPLKEAQDFFCLFITIHLNKKCINQIVALLTYFNIFRHKYLYIETIETKDSEFNEIVYREKNILCASKPQYYYQKHDLFYFNERNIRAALLTNATIFGSSDIVLLNNRKALYELFYFDENNKFKYTDTTILSCADGRLIIQYKESNKIIENGIMFSGNFSFNYYHFIFEILSKFMLLDKIDVPKNIPLILDDIVDNVPQFKELLDCFNVDNRDVIYLKRKYDYKVKKLHYLSHINFIPPNYKNIDDINFTDCQFDINSINFIRNKLLQLRKTPPNFKKIYLSRQNTSSSRRKYNESEILNIFRKYGFEVVTPEKHSIAEQVSLFNNADFIAGVTGAAFTNILFCKNKCKILCIQSSENELSIFSTIAKCLELDMQYFSANDKQRKNNDIHDEFTVDPTKIEEVLIDFLRK